MSEAAIPPVPWGVPAGSPEKCSCHRWTSYKRSHVPSSGRCLCRWPLWRTVNKAKTKAVIGWVLCKLCYLYEWQSHSFQNILTTSWENYVEAEYWEVLLWTLKDLVYFFKPLGGSATTCNQLQHTMILESCSTCTYSWLFTNVSINLVN